MISIQQAILRIKEELESDPTYYNRWRTNIKLHFLNAYEDNSISEPEGFIFCPTSDDIINIANQASDNFLENIINYE